MTLTLLRRLLAALRRRRARPAVGTRTVLPGAWVPPDTPRSLPLLPPGPDELATRTRLRHALDNPPATEQGPTP